VADHVGLGDDKDGTGVAESERWTRSHDEGAALRERLKVELGSGVDVAWRCQCRVTPMWRRKDVRV
jgi:hypothetical protein